MNSVRSRLIGGISANLYGQVLVAVIQLASVPILLHAWGARLYGEWLVLFAIPGYLSMSELGFAQSAANDMTQSMARHEVDASLRVFQSLIALVCVASTVGLAVSTAVIWWVAPESAFPVGALTANGARWVLWLLSAEILVRIADGVNHAGYRAGGEYAFHTSAYYTTLIVQHGCGWALALRGFGPVAAAASFLAVRIVSNIALAAWLAHKQTWLRFGFSLATRSELRRLLKPAMANLGLPLARALNIQGMVLVVASTLGPVAVVTFSTLRTLTRLTLQSTMSISNAAEPELASAYGAADTPLLQRIFEQASRASVWFAGPVALLTLFAGPLVLKIWTHGRVAMDSTLFHWLLASAVASAFWYTGLAVLKAANVHLQAAYTYAVAAGAVVMVAYWALQATNDLAYAGVSLIGVDCVMLIYVIRSAAHLIGFQPSQLLLRVLNPMPLLGFTWKRVSAL